jgi:hypothetical protein
MIATTTGNDQAREIRRRLRSEDTKELHRRARFVMSAEFSRLIPRQSKGTPAAINIGARVRVESVIGVVRAGFSIARAPGRPKYLSDRQSLTTC